MQAQTRPLLKDVAPIVTVLSYFVFLAWMTAPSLAVNPSHPLEAFSFLMIPIVWIAIGMGNSIYYRRTRDYVEEINNTGIMFLILTCCGPIGIVLNVLRKDDSPVRPFFR